jgi:hypothetical protein
MVTLTVPDGETLAHKGVNTISQLLEVNDLTGTLTSTAIAALLTELAPFPLLQHKIRLLVKTIL